MKSVQHYILIGLLCLPALTGCKKWLGINADPDTPQSPSASSVFPTQLTGITRGVQWDARYLGKYIQNWLTSATSRPATEMTWDRHGYVDASDNSGDIWRQTYFGLGKNLDYIIDVGSRAGQWDYVGAAYALKAYMFQICTDYHGEIIFTEAFAENLAVFKFDDQETVYAGVRAFADSALKYLDRTDLSPSNPKLAVADYVYNGDAAKWKRFVYGILARNYHNLTNKSMYDPDKVLEYVGLAMQSGADDFLLPFDATKNDDANFFGPFRDNMTYFRQSNFIVQLLDGTTLTGSSDKANRDPRLPHMLSASQDTSNGNGGYRGVNPTEGDLGSGRTRVAVLWGDSVYVNPRTAGVFIPNLGKYLFKDKAVSPVMTFSEMQFIKAEALYRKGTDMTGALDAYRKGIEAHFDFINRSSFPRANTTLFNGSPISTEAREAYMNGPAVKKDPAQLTLTDIMLQKYIALWGWGFVETWTDLRRYHYTDPDPVTGEQVYKGFTFPATFEATNQGKPAYRMRPRYNSEYVWNRDELQRIGALNPDYNTYEMWFSKP